MKKIVVFPNDPLEKYYLKGVVKTRYFNPKNIFSDVYVVSLAGSDIDPNLVREFVSDARLFIHSVLCRLCPSFGVPDLMKV